MDLTAHTIHMCVYRKSIGLAHAKILPLLCSSNSVPGLSAFVDGDKVVNSCGCGTPAPTPAGGPMNSNGSALSGPPPAGGLPGPPLPRAQQPQPPAAASPAVPAPAGPVSSSWPAGAPPPATPVPVAAQTGPGVPQKRRGWGEPQLPSSSSTQEILRTLGVGPYQSASVQQPSANVQSGFQQPASLVQPTAQQAGFQQSGLAGGGQLGGGALPIG